MNNNDKKLLKIGVFYDGGFFYHVSNYYRYAHPRKHRISIPGLHDFIRYLAAEHEGVDLSAAQIVDSHFFRGRFSARESEAHQKLYFERSFDDILMNEGVTTHYLPIPNKTEKGIDVWIALEAFELAIHKNFDVLVLIAGDSDFLPLVRKIHSLGTRLMVLGWDFNYTDDFGKERMTMTSPRLLKEASYPVVMNEVIDDNLEQDRQYIDNLFNDAVDFSIKSRVTAVPEPPPPPEPPVDDNRSKGTILRLNEGYGFIKCSQYPNNVFFHWESLSNRDFTELRSGQPVTFEVKIGDHGPVALDVVVDEELL